MSIALTMDNQDSQHTRHSSQLDLEWIPKAAKSLVETQVGDYGNVPDLAGMRIHCRKYRI